METTRREFLARSATWAGAPCVVAASALGAESVPPPSERIAIGLIGIGAMGQGHLSCLLGYADVQVVAVCDVDRWRRETAQKRTDETYAARGDKGRFRGCAAYNDLRELLARGDVDAVLIATGDRWHAAATVLAAQAGKDIYCEKPVSLTVREARAMVAAVRRYGRVFQAGLQQRSAVEFRRACELVRGGAIGKVTMVYVNHPGTTTDVDLPAEPVPEGLDWDLWLGPSPWRAYNRRFHPFGRPPHVVPWHFCRDFGGGNLTSNGVHAFDVVQWGLGMDESGPLEIVPPETGQYPSLTYKYAGGTLVQVAGGRLDPQKHHVPKGWDPATPISMFGAVFVGEGGWIHVGRNGYLRAFPEEILKQPAVANDHRHAVAGHHQNWLDCIRSRQRTACDVTVGCQSTIVAHLGCIAHWTGRALRWDPQRAVFPDDPQANRWLGRAMREPWKIL